MQLLQNIELWAKESPTKLALVSRSGHITYRELREQSNAVANWLQKSNIEERSPIIVYGHMEPGMVVAFLACVKAGHLYIPIDDSTPEERVSRIIRHSQSKMIVSPVEFPSALRSKEIEVLDNSSNQLCTFDEVAQRTSQLIDPSLSVDGENTFYIIYTSGSTGEPKGVQISANALDSFLSWTSRGFNIGLGQTYLNQAPFSFDLSVMDLYTCLTTGGTLWTADRSMIMNMRDLFSGLATSNVNVWVSTPSFVELCLMDKSFNDQLLPQLRTFLFCGEILPGSCAEKLLTRFPKAEIYNTYGPTEATVAVTSIRIDAVVVERYTPLPVGYCKPDCKILIVDEEGNPLPDGEKGEIVICGATVSSGYFRNEVMNKKSFFVVDDTDLGTTRAYKTGDYGYLESGLLFCGGRMDFQIKLHGYRIELEDIEYHLTQLPLVKSAVVVPVIKDGKCDSLAAFVVPDSQVNERESSIVSKIKQDLSALVPKYMVPRKIVIINRLPLTTNGKVDRKSLSAEVNI